MERMVPVQSRHTRLAEQCIGEAILTLMCLDTRHLALRTSHLIIIVAPTFTPEDLVGEIFQVLLRPNLERSILRNRKVNAFSPSTKKKEERAHRFAGISRPFLNGMAVIESAESVDLQSARGGRSLAGHPGRIHPGTFRGAVLLAVRVGRTRERRRVGGEREEQGGRETRRLARRLLAINKFGFPFWDWPHSLSPSPPISIRVPQDIFHEILGALSSRGNSKTLQNCLYRNPFLDFARATLFFALPTIHQA
ncbi:hypothetical protein C8R46DRAFT_1042378 [Mycena filopes]|nr:hypothetical protein C8R46DRAFT_1042378 [Mycena filopes]